ncbi:hypothetical protein Tco_1558596, partial [Tanacetum coccineum]
MKPTPLSQNAPLQNHIATTQKTVTTTTCRSGFHSGFQWLIVSKAHLMVVGFAADVPIENDYRVDLDDQTNSGVHDEEASDVGKDFDVRLDVSQDMPDIDFDSRGWLNEEQTPYCEIHVFGSLAPQGDT